MSATIVASIDVTKIPKNKLVTGKKGTYLDVVLFVNDSVNDYGKNVSVAVSQSKEERASGSETLWLGSGKVLITDGVIVASEAEGQSTTTSNTGLPF
jgi:hypothetical protein